MCIEGNVNKNIFHNFHKQTMKKMGSILGIVAAILAVVFGVYKYNSPSTSGDVITTTTTGNGNDGTMTDRGTSTSTNYPDDRSYDGSNIPGSDAVPNSSGDYTAPQVAEQWKLIPYKQVGPINDRFTEQDLINTFGAANVKRETVGRRWGETIPATILFPETKNKVTIEWLDGKPYQRIKKLRIEEDGSDWQTAEGIRIGTTFDDLKRINQGPFQFYGFDWEYAGKVDDWQGGNIHKYMTVFLTPKNPKAVFPAMLGDSLYLSEHPKANEAGFYVSSIEIRM